MCLFFVCHYVCLCVCFRRTALHCAAYGGFTECLNVLLSEGQASIDLQDSEGITALHWACSVGHMEAVQLLVAAGAGVNVMELDGERLTPLDYAIIGGHQEVVQLLIESGALSISSIRELAAIMVQKCVRGFLARSAVLPLLRKAREERRSVSAHEAAAKAKDRGAPIAAIAVVSSRGKDATDAVTPVSSASRRSREESRAR